MAILLQGLTLNLTLHPCPLLIPLTPWGLSYKMVHTATCTTAWTCCRFLSCTPALLQVPSCTPPLLQVPSCTLPLLQVPLLHPSPQPSASPDTWTAAIMLGPTRCATFFFVVEDSRRDDLSCTLEGASWHASAYWTPKTFTEMSGP